MNITSQSVGAAGIFLLAGSVAAAPYDGLYRSSGDADCARVGEEGGALRIEEGLFQGVGSECRMTRPVDVVDMDATLYTMECSAGDTRWTERALLMKAAQDDGLIMLWNGYAFRYARCEAGDESEVPDEAGAGAALELEEDATGLPPSRVVLPWVELPLVTLPGITLPGVLPPFAVEPDDAPAPNPSSGPRKNDDPGEARGGTAAQIRDAGDAG